MEDVRMHVYVRMRVRVWVIHYLHGTKYHKHSFCERENKTKRKNLEEEEEEEENKSSIPKNKIPVVIIK